MLEALTSLLSLTEGGAKGHFHLCFVKACAGVCRKRFTSITRAHTSGSPLCACCPCFLNLCPWHPTGLVNWLLRITGICLPFHTAIEQHLLPSEGDELSVHSPHVLPTQTTGFPSAVPLMSSTVPTTESAAIPTAGECPTTGQRVFGFHLSAPDCLSASLSSTRATECLSVADTACTLLRAQSP